ncbi:MAG: DUF2141 domain-containing protein [Myxococcota bacterium]|nr:DUF2141 domain-containing protein [Myxococcota bacterium]
MSRFAAILGAALLALGAPGTLGAETAPASETGRITVVFTGCENDEGRALIALVRSEAAWEADDDAFRQARPPIVAGEARHTFEDLPFGSYAVKVIHDENDNGELDTNFIGVPREAFGFSNDAMGRFGPPDYEAARFELEGEELVLEIRSRRL